MKKNILLLLLTITFLLIPFDIKAAYDAVLTDTVNVRKGAGTNHASLLQASKGSEVSVVDKTLYTGTGCSNKWYKVTYNNQTGYICSTYISFIDTASSGINVVDWTARVNGNDVTVRKGAGTNYGSAGTLTLGTNVNILSTHNGGTSGCSGGKWHKISYYNNATGYMCANYITKKSDITAKDSSYEQSLKTAGFPESYWPYLTYLHKKYPNWIFSASKTNLNFTASVNAESGKNYMQTKNDYYRTSSTPAEGTSWFYANKGVIAFYMDPRNWLTEERIFMFEKQDYSTALESSYKTLVKSIFGSGTLSNDKYIVPMVNAGKANSISPVLIASRIRLEVGANGSASTSGGSFKWKGVTYSGYYNFFNIGAYETTVDGVKYDSVTRGLAYAAKLISRSGEKWDNIQTSITEGSAFLANGYVNKGQGSLYYQKFNTAPNAYYDKYTHQYQTNVQAPAIEGNSAYNSYKTSGLLSSKFVFDIPVYNSMPSYTSLPNSGNSNNNLKNLEIEGYSLSPDFDKDILTYTAYVPLTVNKIKIKATADANTSSITGTGEIEIKEKENQITITVTSESGSEKKYVITVYKVENATTVSSVIKQSKGVVSGDYVTNISNGSTVNSYKNNLIKAGANAVNIVDSNGKTISGSAILTTNSKITIITANDTKTYTFSVNGDTSGDGQITILDLLQVQNHIKNINKLSGAKNLAADTSGDGKITILDLLQVQNHIKGIKKL